MVHKLHIDHQEELMALVRKNLGLAFQAHQRGNEIMALSYEIIAGNKLARVVKMNTNTRETKPA